MVVSYIMVWGFMFFLNVLCDVLAYGINSKKIFLHVCKQRRRNRRPDVNINVVPQNENQHPPVQNPQPQIQNAHPHVPNPQPQNQNPQPQNQNPQPQNQNPQPQNQNQRSLSRRDNWPIDNQIAGQRSEVKRDAEREGEFHRLNFFDWLNPNKGQDQSQNQNPTENTYLNYSREQVQIETTSLMSELVGV